MPITLDDARRALAANLRLVLPASEGHVGAYFQDAPKIPALQVMGVNDFDFADVGGGIRYELGIEGILGRIVDRSSQTRLDEWIHGGGILYALDSSVNPLTSRLRDTGVIDEGEEDAGTSAYLRFGGQGRLKRGGVDVLVATWFCEWYPPPEIFT
jgi:hypothetical protein